MLTQTTIYNPSRERSIEHRDDKVSLIEVNVDVVATKYQRLFMVRLCTMLALPSLSEEVTIGFSLGGVSKIKFFFRAVANFSLYFCLLINLP